MRLVFRWLAPALTVAVLLWPGVTTATHVARPDHGRCASPSKMSAYLRQEQLEAVRFFSVDPFNGEMVQVWHSLGGRTWTFVAIRLVAPGQFEACIWLAGRNAVLVPWRE